MDWKQFIKPNKKKIIVSILFPFIIFLFFILSVIFYQIPDEIMTYFLGPVLILILWPIFLVWKLFPNYAFGYILLVIYWYLFSCLLVWVCNRFRKDRKKTKMYYKIILIAFVVILVSLAIFLLIRENEQKKMIKFFEDSTKNVFENCNYYNTKDYGNSVSIWYNCPDNSYELIFIWHPDGKVSDCCINFDNSLETYKGYSICMQSGKQVPTINNFNYMLLVDPRDETPEEPLKELTVNIANNLDFRDIGFNANMNCRIPGV